MRIKAREIWKPLKEIDIDGSHYTLKHKIYVSNYGKVRRYYKDGWIDAKGNNYKELTSYECNGYKFVGIKVEGEDHSKAVSVHRLVALLFVPNPDPEKYNIVNHLDCNGLNNYYKNLEWTTYKGNSVHAVKNNKVKMPTIKMFGASNSMATHSIEDILKIKDMILSGMSVKEIAAKTGNREEYIYRIKSGKRWGQITGFGGHEVIDISQLNSQFDRARIVKKLIVEGHDDTDYIINYVKEKYNEDLDRKYVIKLKSKTKKRIAQGSKIKL